MQGIDTNILVRYITQDDPIQSKIAADFIEGKCTTDTPGIINQIVLCEVVWVLKKAYCYDKSIIIKVIHNLICCTELNILDRDCARNALLEYDNGDADFSDYFIGQINKLHNASYTVTFDKKAAKNLNFLLLK